MKISKRTVNLLKNFSGVNPSIVLQAGSTIRTQSMAENIYGIYRCEEEFPFNVPLYDLNNFLATLALFDDANVEFKDGYALIEGDSSKMKYTYDEEGMVKEPTTIPDNAFDDPKVTFDLDSEKITTLLRASSVIDSDIISISTNEENIINVTANHSLNVDAKRFEVLTDHNSEDQFNVVLRVENLKMVPTDYTVQLYDNFALFKADDLEYVVATEHESSWG